MDATEASYWFCSPVKPSHADMACCLGDWDKKHKRLYHRNFSAGEAIAKPSGHSHNVAKKIIIIIIMKVKTGTQAQVWH